jgi:hypothetical protein
MGLDAVRGASDLRYVRRAGGHIGWRMDDLTGLIIAQSAATMRSEEDWWAYGVRDDVTRPDNSVKRELLTPDEVMRLDSSLEILLRQG